MEVIWVPISNHHFKCFVNNDYENASKLINKDENNSIWNLSSRFFYAKLLLKNKMIEESKEILNKRADGRFFGWQAGLH